jgi:hypothetical protein
VGAAQRIEFPASRARVLRVRLLLRSALFIAWCCASPGASAQVGPGPAVPERTVKAAFLYKFAGYVQWPDAPDGAAGEPLSIGVLGADDFARELAAVTSGRTVVDRPITVRRLAPGDLLDDLHILFVGQDDDDRLGDSLAAARGRPILIVTESEGALDDGSMINFAVDRQRVRFDVSLSSAERNGLRLNSRLLAVARRVYREPE